MSIPVARSAVATAGLALILAASGARAQDMADRWSAGDTRFARHADTAHMQAREDGDHPKECYARVRYDAPPAPPPMGPHYVWRQAPAPPGAPGPVWCLVLESAAAAPPAPIPETMGWIRVLCADEVTPARVRRLQHGLAERGLYRGGFDGRYDAQTASAVSAFQSRAHIAHDGYLSYQTYTTLNAPPPYGWRAPTTFDTGVLDWPGKVRRF